MNKEKILVSGLIQKYVLNLLSSKEKVRIEHIARKCPKIHAQIVNLQNALKVFASEVTKDTSAYLPSASGSSPGDDSK